MKEEEMKKISLIRHLEAKGKISIVPKVKIKNKDDLSIYYTPGVAEPCLEIAKKPGDVYAYTSKGNMVAIVTDGTAVLGLGDIGPSAAIPVMEGKAVLFKEFAGIDAFPICLKTKDVDEIVETVERICPVFGAINLEDISAPRCFEIEEKLQKRLDIPVMHDDQHGTAVVVASALTNAYNLAGKHFGYGKVVINGVGAAGSAIANMLLERGEKNIVLCDRKGIANESTFSDAHRKKLVSRTNPDGIEGDLSYAMKDADVFIGVSGPNALTAEMVKSMNAKSIVFALANPVPEIFPEEAKKGGAFIVGTGRSDYPNQINNALGFPGIFRGLLDSGARKIGRHDYAAAIEALSSCIPENKLTTECIIPSPFDKEVVKNIAHYVSESSRPKMPQI